jgi:photosystem II stability/assembly factor-like uncharacterized protein
MRTTHTISFWTILFLVSALGIASAQQGSICNNEFGCGSTRVESAQSILANKEGSPELQKARHDWFWKGKMTPGADLFLLRRKALQKVEAMRARYRTTSLGPLVTQPWRPAFSATTNFYGIRSAGATVGMAIDPANPSTVYTASAGGGLWKTTDAGTSWTPQTDQQAFTEDGSLAMDPNNPDVLYLGGAGEYAGGILKSFDAGATWSLITGPFVGPFDANEYFGGSDWIRSIAVQPSNLSVMLVGTSGGHLWALYRTADGGNTWTTVINNNAAISDIHFDPNDSNIVYAAVCGGYAGAAANEGIYKSADGGITWSLLSGGLPSPSQLSNADCRLGISPSNPSVLAAIFRGASGQSPTVFTTSDSGNTWVQVASPPDFPHGAGIFFNPTSPNVLFVGAADFYRSMDGGMTWQSILNGIHVDQGAFAWVGNTNQLYIGNDGGVFYTPDATAAVVNWTNLNNGLATLRLYPGMALHPTDANIVLAGTQDEGTILSNDSLDWNTVACGDSAFTAFDPGYPFNLYANCYYASIQKSTDGGASFSLAINGINTGDPMEFFPPLVMDPSDGSRLYFGTNRVYQTSDGAQTWTPISPAFNVLSRIAVSPKDSNIVYAAENQKVWTTTNALSGTSATWSGSTNGLPPRDIVGLVASPSRSQTAYAAVSGFSGFLDNLGHVFKTIDGGQTWTDISGNLPNIPADDIAADPDRPNTLYLATDVGVFLTVNGGVTWVPLGSALPNIVVTSIRLFEPLRTLRVSTFGRGVWDLQLMGKHHRGAGSAP